MSAFMTIALEMKFRLEFRAEGGKASRDNDIKTNDLTLPCVASNSLLQWSHSPGYLALIW